MRRLISSGSRSNRASGYLAPFVSDLFEQVVRTRTLLTRIEDWQAVASVHGEFFGMIRPANTIMQVSRFIDPDWLVELEADAIAESETSTD